MMKSCLVKANGPSRKMPTSQIKHWKYDSIFKRKLITLYDDHLLLSPIPGVILPCQSWLLVLAVVDQQSFLTCHCMLDFPLNHCIIGSRLAEQALMMETFMFKPLYLTRALKPWKLRGCLIATAHTVFFNFRTAFPITACFKHTAHSQTVCTKRNIKCSLK